MNRYCAWVLDYTQRNPLKAVAIAFVKGLVIAALLLGCSSSAKAQDIYIQNVDLEFGTFDVGVTDLGNDLTVSSFTLWISEPDWDATEVVLNDEEVLPFLDTHLYDIDWEITPGEWYTLQLPLSWRNWLDHGIFSDQDNVAVIGVWGMNDYIPWIYGQDSDWPTTDGNANNYVFVQAEPTQNVVTEVVEIAQATIYIYVDSTTGVEVAEVGIPQIAAASNGTLYVQALGDYETFELTIYGLSGQILWNTTDPWESYSHNNAAGIYTYVLNMTIGGQTYTQTNSIYFN